ncbi:MAG: hypothetical protein EZS28_019243, partial [Streblomastix strix]
HIQCYAMADGIHMAFLIESWHKDFYIQQNIEQRNKPKEWLKINE